MVAKTTKFVKRLSINLRHGTAVQRKALLKWINVPKFRGRKPTPDELTAECLDKDSPLYGLLKTTQKAAAAVYYRQTSQDILRHIDIVEVEITTQKVLSKPVVAYVHTGRGRYGQIADDAYVPTQRVPDMPLLKKSILDRAHSDFLAWLDRYERYSEFMGEFSPVVAAYREIEKRRVKEVAA